MARRAGSHRARWLVACLAPAVIAACGITDQRFIEPAAAPRLIVPSSLGRVTVQKPRLVWTQGPGGGVASVELCKDRACTMPIAAPLSEVTTGGDGLLSAVPLEPLPLGWVYWRVRVALGDQEQISPTWQFWVPRSVGGTPIDVDTTGGLIFDLDGDGYADLLVASAGAREHGETGGRVHVYLGSGSPEAASWNGASPARRIDIVVPANSPTYFALDVSPVGDVNGDGFADFVVGDPFAVDGGGSMTGAAFLYLGSAAPSADRWNGPAAPDRIALVSPDGQGAFGNPAVAIGDVNRDGYGDFLVATSVFGGTQPARVYLGTATPGDAAWSGGNAPRRIEVPNPDGVSSLLATAASAGDVNGDGFADFLIGTSGSNNEGAVHLYLGSATPEYATWNSEPASARIDLASPDGAAGKFFLVAGAGDVNGDGFSDFVVGAPTASASVGVAHLYLGARDPAAGWAGATPAARIDLGSPDTTMTEFGTIVASAGDVNGDGLGDFVVSGYGANFGKANAGTSHVYLGVQSPSSAAWNGANPPRRIDLIAPEGTTGAYGDLPLANGSLNGDLYDDIAISSPSANGDVGVVYVYFGSGSPSTLLWNGASPSRRLALTGPDAAGSDYGGMR